MNKELKETLLVEYAAVQSDYLHNDNFPWQIGSILIAGSFIFWALLIDTYICSQLFGITSFFVTILLSVWILYAHHFRQTYLLKLHRMWEIESKLGMKSHIRWKKLKNNKKEPIYKTFGPRGHDMNTFVYCVTCLVGPIIGYFKSGFSFWLLLPIPFIVITILLICINEDKIQKQLIRLEDKKYKRDGTDSKKIKV